MRSSSSLYSSLIIIETRQKIAENAKTIKWLPAHLDDNNCAQMRSSSSSSSGDWSDETCKGILSQGAPVSVARPFD